MTVTVDGNTVSGTDWNSKNNKNPYEIDDAKKLTINNSRKISITGTKIWKDQNNACNRRPDAADPKKVVLTVLANGKQVTPQPKVTWDTTNDGTGTWTYKIEGLAKEDANGPIEYTVKEEKVPGYQAAYEQQTKDAKGNIIQNITNSMLKASYKIEESRLTNATENGKTGTWGFVKGDPVEYQVTVENTGDLELTMDVKDEFADSKYFTDLTYTEVKAGKDSAASDVAWNNNAGGGATATAPNITVKAGKTAVIIVTAKVAQDTPEKLSDTTEYRKDPQSKGYLNTMTAINVKGTYTDKDDKGNDKSVVVTEKEFPTELADKKDICTTPVQVPGTLGTPGTPDSPSGSTNEHKGGRTGKTTKVQVAATKTGDSANLILYGGIAMVSLVLLQGVLIIFLVKRRHK